MYVTAAVLSVLRAFVTLNTGASKALPKAVSPRGGSHAGG